MKPSIGRIVIYKLSELDAFNIEWRRTHHRPFLNGANAREAGSYVIAGEEVPLVIVRVWEDEFGPGMPGVNGQALLDGDDALWVTSAGEGDGPGQWHWPPRV